MRRFNAKTEEHRSLNRTPRLGWNRVREYAGGAQVSQGAVLRFLLTAVIVAWGLALTGCVRMPAGLQPVRHFEADAYMGTWYEIARLDHRFERGLTNVSATYSLKADGQISVVNRGYDPEQGEWRQAEATATLADAAAVGRLKVSFFKPFYGAYNILVLDHDSHALVCGPNRSYLWLLSRTKTMPEALTQTLISQAAAWGFPTDELIPVPHDRTDPALVED